MTSATDNLNNLNNLKGETMTNNDNLEICDLLDYDECDAMDAREYGDLEQRLEARSMTLHDTGDGRVVAWMYDTLGHRIDPIACDDQPECECDETDEHDEPSAAFRPSIAFLMNTAARTG